jgi:hypothetical protein
MLADLAALTPPLIVGGVFVIGVVMFLRRQMGPAAGPAEDDQAEILDDRGNADRADPARDPSGNRPKV